MILVAKTYWAGAPFDFRTRPRDVLVEPATLKAADGRELRGLYWTPSAVARPRVAALAMHPRADFTHHYTFPRLLAAGIACLGAVTRSGSDDTDLEHEVALLDVAACVRFLRVERGVEKVILLGNCGGGSLLAFYQAQARLAPAERIARTPAGGHTLLPSAEMLPADAMIYIAAHRGQGQVLGDSIDPSVIDERYPHGTDPDLDMYDVKNGFRPPPQWSEYPGDFIARFRAGQRARARRLDVMARALLADSRAAGSLARQPGFDALPFPEQQRIQRREACEPLMVVYRTMANLHYTDRRLDPSEREYGSLLSDRPDLMNFARLGFGRVCTPRAWLSTWSRAASNASLIENVARIKEPTLVVHAGRDREIYPRTDARPIFAAVAAPDRTFVEQPTARHYFEPDFGDTVAPEVERLMDTVTAWIKDRFDTSERAPARPAQAASPARHPTADTWQLPSPDRPPLPGLLRRTNLRELAARPTRFEHHLVVVAQIGIAQLEVVVASEPLAFGHCHLSDEYVLALSTGDPLVDAAPLRTFLTDPATFADVARIHHRVGDLVLNPYGLLHWPGRLRPPHEPFRFPAGMRRAGLALVYCASDPSPPTARPLFVSAGRAADAKTHGDNVVPLLLTDTHHDPGAPIAVIADTTMELLVAPSAITAPRGGYLVVLDAAPDSLHFAADLVYIPPGETVPTQGLRRALLLSSKTREPDPPPPSWTDAPSGPFNVFEDAAPGSLPVVIGNLTVEAASPETVTLRLGGLPAGEVPRFWLARTLFRVALHRHSLGYVETYGGFFADDREDVHQLGVRGYGAVTLPRAEMERAVETLYRAVAPVGYTERST